MVEFWRLDVVSVDEVVEHILDSGIQALLLEERQDLIDAQAVLDALLRCAVHRTTQPPNHPFVHVHLRTREFVFFGLPLVRTYVRTHART